MPPIGPRAERGGAQNPTPTAPPIPPLPRALTVDHQLLGPPGRGLVAHKRALGGGEAGLHRGAAGSGAGWAWDLADVGGAATAR